MRKRKPNCVLKEMRKRKPNCVLKETKHSLVFFFSFPLKHSLVFFFSFPLKQSLFYFKTKFGVIFPKGYCNKKGFPIAMLKLVFLATEFLPVLETTYSSLYNKNMPIFLVES
jgi:hypothetical protein